jgi:hypothetical protein
MHPISAIRTWRTAPTKWNIMFCSLSQFPFDNADDMRATMPMKEEDTVQ